MVCSCKHANTDIERLIYEGMSGKDLMETLGNPDSIVVTGEVRIISQLAMRKVEKWYYPKRVVVLINDTVKNPNTN